MFRQIAATHTTYDQIIRAHPARLSALLEAHWHLFNGHAVGIAPPEPNLPYGLESIGSTAPAWLPLAPVPNPPPIAWDHLIYAYMAENTRVFEIFERVVRAFVHGERFGVPSRESQAWLRATEELFFRPSGPYTLGTLTSDLRPDARAGRRNAYYRMFGLDLNHGASDNRAYVYEKSDAANREFIATLERLLHEVWRGIVNVLNTSGSRDTDVEAVHTLCNSLRDMLTLRRRNGVLSREEFWYTSTMSWFHMALEQNSPIVADLQADATSPEDRLTKIGNRVGLAAHGKSRSFLILADRMSEFLIGIETGMFQSLAQSQTLFTVAPTRDMMQEIITHYSIATGRDIKASTVTQVAVRR